MKPQIEELLPDIEDLDFTIVESSMSNINVEYKDNRDYVDRIFQEHTVAGARNKPIREIRCVDNEEPGTLDGEIAILLNYKKIKTRGRKMPLAGDDLLHVDTPTGCLRLPLNQVEKFAKYLLAIAKSSVKKNHSSLNDDLETPSK